MMGALIASMEVTNELSEALLPELEGIAKNVRPLSIDDHLLFRVFSLETSRSRPCSCFLSD